ncbi:Cyclin-dependent protein kinase inhibitor SMR3 [Striga hermonthica]|uniref:Cyclin-dependent protein kinase inhibitor SMR3 n=1 Tax=Striga hermonthica TaxID=68872 RepID=A0A9N7R6E9_STRHE|nr:Cyclin-dependent protein kinase inhibitor SMR3 [Striga hermonthica]
MSTDLEFRLPAIEISSDRRDVVADVDECHTPRSPRHMIPAAVICPPAPKKRRPAGPASCKRKLWDLDFFEIVAREEVEFMFRSTTVQVNLNGSIKRKCIA